MYISSSGKPALPPCEHLVPLCFILRCPFNRVRILSVHIDQNHITAQAGERFIPSLPHAGVGQKGAFGSATHEPFQRGVPSLPCHSVHGTSWKLPFIARWPSGKKACEAPERSHRSKLRMNFDVSMPCPNWQGKKRTA